MATEENTGSKIVDLADQVGSLSQKDRLILDEYLDAQLGIAPPPSPSVDAGKTEQGGKS
jgi:hypothetical protein